MREFRAAAQAAAENTATLEFTLGELDPDPFIVTVPTTGQVSLVIASMDDGGTEMIAAVYSFLRGLMSVEDFRRLRGYIADGSLIEVLIGGDDDNDDGIVDWIIGQATSRPPTRPTDYLPSQKPGGRRSTGRSPGKGSTRSDLAPVAS